MTIGLLLCYSGGTNWVLLGRESMEMQLQPNNGGNGLWMALLRVYFTAHVEDGSYVVCDDSSLMRDSVGSE